jgi:MYXO-CTERM domain-containing protein
MGDVSPKPPVDDYLDTLFDRLSGTGAEGRRLLAEAEDHLRSAADDGIARGLEPLAAEREAVRRFGPPPGRPWPWLGSAVAGGLAVPLLVYALTGFLGRAVAHAFSAVVTANGGFGVADLADVCASPIIGPTVTCTDPPSGTLLDNLLEPLPGVWTAAAALLTGALLLLPARRLPRRARSILGRAATDVAAVLLLVTAIETFSGPWSHVARDGGAALAALAIAALTSRRRRQANGADKPPALTSHQH